jgi:hypothetical protein
MGEVKMRLAWLRRCGFWAAVCSLALCLVVSGVLAGSPAQAGPVPLQTGTVDIAVVPSEVTVELKETFTLEIWIYPHDQQVDTVDADLTFDPTYLEVLSITGDPAALPEELYSVFDNTSGTLTHSRGVLVGTPPSSDFRLCSIELRAKAITDGGVLSLSKGTILAFTGLTDAYFAGKSLLDISSDGTVTVTGWQVLLPMVLKSAASAPSLDL